MLSITRILIVAFALVVVGIAGADSNKAPDFSLETLDGKTMKLSEVYKEGPVLLTFWSTWCKNCPEEMKHFQRFYDQYKEEGFTVLAVSIDGTKTISKVKPWITGRRLSYPILLDRKGDVKRLYHVKPVPHSFVIDTTGEIVYSHIGYRAGDETAYEKAIKKLLTQPAEQG